MRSIASADVARSVIYVCQSQR